MNVVEIHNVAPGARIVSVAHTAMFLNLMYHEAVEELLEVYTDFTDFDIIAEIIDYLDLNITCVVEASNSHGRLIHGYIHGGALA